MAKPTGRPDVQSVRAAAAILYKEGQMQGWWDTEANSYEDLDVIGKMEFEGIVERILVAAQQKKEG